VATGKNNSYNKSQQDALFLYFILVKNSTCFGHLLSIIRSLNTVFTATGICHTSYVDVCSEVGMELVGLLTFVIRIYHDAQSSECQIGKNYIINNYSVG